MLPDIENNHQQDHQFNVIADVPGKYRALYPQAIFGFGAMAMGLVMGVGSEFSGMSAFFAATGTLSSASFTYFMCKDNPKIRSFLNNFRGSENQLEINTLPEEIERPSRAAILDMPNDALGSLGELIQNYDVNQFVGFMNILLSGESQKDRFNNLLSGNFIRDDQQRLAKYVAQEFTVWGPFEEFLALSKIVLHLSMNDDLALGIDRESLKEKYKSFTDNLINESAEKYSELQMRIVNVYVSEFAQKITDNAPLDDLFFNGIRNRVSGLISGNETPFNVAASPEAPFLQADLSDIEINLPAQEPTSVSPQEVNIVVASNLDDQITNSSQEEFLESKMDDNSSDKSDEKSGARSGYSKVKSEAESDNESSKSEEDSPTSSFLAYQSDSIVKSDSKTPDR